ncbi:restriction endonuclease subunit S [Pedobacter polysacchareus]|uniref:restriction endonuclease subunit S n=1 Tax=Pedobacter polysacchareus TaxID=2861973 RepID=UPI001C99995C|nr:restriction endonuclease subunit S [Pedobacter polysacchareus]
MRTEKFKSLFYFAPNSKIKAGDGLDNGNYPLYTSSFVLKKRFDRAQYYDDALIFGTGGSASIHFTNEPFSTSTDCLVAIAKQKELNTKFVYYYLFGNLHFLERGFKGAGLKHISKKYIENLDIPILSIEMQNKIVAVLDKAGVLVIKRKEIAQLMNDFLRATFLDMFGDPVLNPNKWPTDSLDKIGEFRSGGTPSKENFNYWIGKFPWISPKDMKNNYITDSIDQISELVFKETSLKKIEPRNILIVVRGMILAHSFPVAMNTIPVAINQDMKAIKLYNKYEPEYVLHCLLILKNWILQYVSSAAHGTKKLTTDSFQKIIIPCPPLNIQQRFVEISNKIDKIKNDISNESANEIVLFKSILQKAFNGQLNFNIDIELDALVREIDLQKKENDISKISGDIAYLQKLIDKLNTQEFKEKDLYDKAKHVAFQLMAVKEEKRKVTQEYNDRTQSLELVLK